MRFVARVLSALGVLALALAAASCPGRQPGASGAKGQAAANAQGSAGGQKAVASLLDLPGLASSPPLALDFTRDLKTVFVILNVPEFDSPAVGRGTFTDGKLDLQGHFAGQFLLHAYVSAQPAGEECLVTYSRKMQGGAVWDTVVRGTATGPGPIPFETSPGIPQKGPPETFFALEPFYSWDGEQVVVPLHHLGLSICQLDGKAAVYVPYPKLPFTPSAMSFGNMHQKSNKRRIYASFFIPGATEGDRCQLYTLDLDSRKWTKIIETTWIIYHVAGPDFENEPWLVSGSRGPMTNTEHQRFARIALIDPSSGAQDLLEFHGTPEWDVAIDPYGKYVVYTDVDRKAIVRLDPSAGSLDIDPRWYAEDAKLFVNESGEVYAWHREMLVHAEWRDHEHFEEHKSG